MQRFNPNLGQYGSPHELPQMYWNVKSAEQRVKLICDELDKLNAKACQLFANDDALKKYLDHMHVELYRLKDEVSVIRSDMDAQLQGGKTRNPASGDFDRLYVSEKQMYDALRVYASTWKELAESGMTWEDLKKSGHTYQEIDMFGNIYFGDGSIRAKFTDKKDIDVNTPGFGGSIHA